MDVSPLASGTTPMSWTETCFVGACFDDLSDGFAYTNHGNLRAPPPKKYGHIKGLSTIRSSVSLHNLLIRLIRHYFLGGGWH